MMMREKVKSQELSIVDSLAELLCLVFSWCVVMCSQ
jgi:hypothetical protein